MNTKDKTDPPRLTVVICTYNRAELLQTCLESLTQQVVPADQFRVLVVDNNSTDDTAATAKQFQYRLPYLDYCTEAQQGLSHARNRGLHEAQTEWVAYLDDDALARPNWVKRIFDMVEHHPFDAFGGIYLPWYRDGKAPWYLDRYATNRTTMPYRRISELHERCFSGGNAVYRRKAAIEAGAFPTDRGMRGEELGYGEENTLQYSLRRLGYRTGIDPDMNIDHLVPLYKQRLSWFMKRRCTEGRIHLWQGKHDPSFRSCVALFIGFGALDVRNLTRGLWRLMTGSYRLQNLFVDTVPELCFQWQVLLSVLRRQRNQSSR